MSITKFEDIIAWQKARKLNIILYKTLKFNKEYYYKDQILRASLSIMNNIAEGYGRKKKGIHSFSIHSKWIVQRSKEHVISRIRF